MDTNACIEHFVNETDIPRDVLERIIPPAIDALYAARDGGHMMHYAGAAAAVAAYQAARSPLVSDQAQYGGGPAAVRRPVHGGRTG